MTDEIERQGGCACGKVRYRVRGTPIMTHACHCSFCQRETGGAFAVNMLYERARVALEGEVMAVLTPSASGKGQTILRCPDCRVALSSHYPGGGDKVHFVRAGTLDDTSTVEPDVHIYTSSKQPWVIVPDGAPSFAHFYDPREFWSDDTMGRWRAAVG